MNKNVTFLLDSRLGVPAAKPYPRNQRVQNSALSPNENPLLCLSASLPTLATGFHMCTATTLVPV